MAPAAVTEIIWHFAGLLEITDDVARARAEYDEGQYRLQSEDYTTLRPFYDPTIKFDDMDTRPLQPPNASPLVTFHNSLAEFDIAGARLRNPDIPHQTFHPATPILGAPAVGGGGGGGDFKIKITYGTDGDQIDLIVNQHNSMSDDDILLETNGHDANHILDSFQDMRLDAASNVDVMVEASFKQTPSDLALPQDPMGAADFLKIYDDNTASHDGDPSAHSTVPGIYANGQLLDSEPALPSILTDNTDTAPTMAPGPGQLAELGGNHSINDTQIIDLSESARTMIVLGDFFKTDAIIQTNYFVGKDYINQSSDGQTAFPATDNITDNVAHFQNLPGIYADLPSTFAGPNWHVDVVDSNYYNINLVVQQNLLSDNDLTVMDSRDSQYHVAAGGDSLTNLSQILNGTIHYDLIIIGGSYHGANLIFQNNVLYSENAVNQIDNSDGTTQHVVTDGNDLTNYAVITTYGDDNFGEVNPDLQTLLESIQGGATELDLKYGDLIAGNGGTFNVLYITGDYYDINAIWQLNVTSDANTVLQLFDGPSSVPVVGVDGQDVGDPQQTAVTGQNYLINLAEIADVGGTDTFVGGDVYTDTILVQANLVPEDDTKLAQGDTQALANEVVAFVTDPESDSSSDAATTPYVNHNNDDPITHVLT